MVTSLRSKWAAGKAVRAGLAVEGAYLNRYVTDEQRGRRPIFNATLRAGASRLFFRVARSTRMTQIWALRSRLEKQPTDLRRRHHYLRDGALASRLYKPRNCYELPIGAAGLQGSCVPEPELETVFINFLPTPAATKTSMPGCCWNSAFKSVNSVQSEPHFASGKPMLLSPVCGVASPRSGRSLNNPLPARLYQAAISPRSTRGTGGPRF